MVNIIKLPNGILIDSSALLGAGTVRAKKMFLPNNYPSINNITLFDDRVIVTGALGRQFEMTKDGTNQSFPINLIDGQQTSDVTDIFEKLIAVL